MKNILVCALAVFSFFLANGQSSGNTVKVYFHIGQWQFDPAFEDNAVSMNHFIEAINIASEAHRLDSIVVRSYASPEGTAGLNQRLSEKRCQTIASILEKNAGISPDLIRLHPEGVAWKELRDIVADNPDVPSREKILDIIDHTPLSVFDSKGRLVSGRKKQLMDIHGGRPWRWMFDNIFPMLRNSIAVSFYVSADNSNTAAEETNDIAGMTDAVDSTENTYITEVSDLTEVADINEVVDAEQAESEVKPASAFYEPGYILALKTNLLYYGILMPNLELEWLIKDKWSVAIEGNMAWWGHYRNNKSYRMVIIDAEARRWIKPRSPWHGMYVGVVAGGGWYDLLRDSRGYYGEGLLAGLTFGYMWPITRHLSLEAEAGVGYVYTRYKRYKPIDDHHIYMRTKNLNYVGPIKLKFSLVWRFFDINRNKRKGTTL